MVKENIQIVTKKTPEKNKVEADLSGENKNAIQDEINRLDTEYLEIEKRMNEIKREGDEIQRILAKIEEIENNEQIINKIKSGEFTKGDLRKLTKVTPEIAQLIVDKGVEINLINVPKLDLETAKILAKSDSFLNLNGLKSIDIETTKILTQYEHGISLIGLSDVSEDVEDILKTCNGYIIFTGHAGNQIELGDFVKSNVDYEAVPEKDSKSPSGQGEAENVEKDIKEEKNETGGESLSDNPVVKKEQKDVVVEGDGDKKDKEENFHEAVKNNESLRVLDKPREKILVKIDEFKEETDEFNKRFNSLRIKGFKKGDSEFDALMREWHEIRQRHFDFGDMLREQYPDLYKKYEFVFNENFLEENPDANTGLTTIYSFPNEQRETDNEILDIKHEDVGEQDLTPLGEQGSDHTNSSEHYEKGSKEFLGERFHESLKHEKEFYDSIVYDVAKDIGGEDYANATRNSSIFLSGVRKFIEEEKIPEKTKQYFQSLLLRIQNSDPLSLRVEFYHERDRVKKNRLVEEHNQKFATWKASILNLMDTLREVIPDSMVDELLHRSNMFAEPLVWADQKNNEKVQAHEEAPNTQENSLEKQIVSLNVNEIRNIVDKNISEQLENPEVKKYDPEVKSLEIKEQGDKFLLEGNVVVNKAPIYGKVEIKISGKFINKGDTIVLSDSHIDAGGWAKTKYAKSKFKSISKKIIPAIKEALEKREGKEITSMHIKDGQLILETK